MRSYYKINLTLILSGRNVEPATSNCEDIDFILIDFIDWLTLKLIEILKYRIFHVITIEARKQLEKN